jgi:hypothetical protein
LSPDEDETGVLVVVDADEQTRRVLGVTAAVPSESTFRRTLQRLDAGAFDDLAGAWAQRAATPGPGARRVIPWTARPYAARLRLQAAQVAEDSDVSPGLQEVDQAASRQVDLTQCLQIAHQDQAAP